MRNRLTQRPKNWELTGKQIILLERAQQGDCTFCPANRGENQTGHLARWGKKVAKKHEYATGKRRNDKKFREFSYFRGHYLSGYYDAHFDPEAKRKEKSDRIYKKA